MSRTPLLAETVYDAAGWESLAETPGWMATLALLLALGAVLSALCGWRERRVAPRGWRALLALRLLALAAAGAMLVGVERRPMTESEEPSRVVLLTDCSASMELPATEGTDDALTRVDLASTAADNLAQQYAATQSLRRGRFDMAVAYLAADETAPSEAGGVTRLGAALDRVLADNAAAPLAAVVLATDGGWNAGPDPSQAAAEAAQRGVPVHTLGVGALRQPPTVGLRDLAAPGRASVGDRFRATVAAFASDNAATGHKVSLSLHPVDEEDRPGAPVYVDTIDLAIDSERGVGTSRVEIEAETPGLYELVAEIQPTGRDANSADNRLTTRIELVDEPTRVLLAAGGPARDYRFLRDQLYRDDLFECDVLLQSATGAVTQDAREVLAGLPSDAEAWEAYDVLVAIDLDWSLVDEPTQAVIAEWVATRGGGIVVLAGPVYTPGVVRRGMTPALRTLLPVVVRDDPLALNAAMEPSREALPIRLTTAGEGAAFFAASAPEGLSGWDAFPGVYAWPLPTEAKPGATVLARLGSPDGEETPFCVEHHYGAGRVIYFSAAETWRLRRESVDWFTALGAGLLRHASQGRLLGGEAEGSLLVDRPRYDLGETIAIRYVSRSLESSQAGEAGYVRVTTESKSSEAPLLSVEGQPGVYVASLRADEVGRYDAVYFTPAGLRLTASTSVTLPSLESETLVQNVELLRRISAATGGEYIDLTQPDAEAALASLVAGTPSLAETTIELGPPDERFAHQIAQSVLVVMVGALLLEWLLRRAWRLA
ncbi:hypothetical protein MalM25_09780 [Planctomycetes bacterium MalM25]|nr:hypothetical protein MalM25_09780 [Planctomycetes bacterium MalM25]